MKKAIRTTAVIAALSLVFSAFAACSNGTKETETTTTTTAPETINQTTAEPTSEDTTASTTESTAKAEADSMETILNLIKSFPVGTAGSSAKSVDIALRLINFTENCEDTEAAKAEIEKFEDTLNDSQEEMFEQSFAEIDYVARKLINGTSDNYKNYLESSSSKYEKGNYSLDKYEAIFELISDI